MQSIKMSPELKEFYKKLQFMIINNEYEEWFSHKTGICNNLKYYLNHQKVKKHKAILLSDELINQFKQFNLSDAYPFDFGNFRNYMNDDLKYENPFRLYWINEMAKPEPIEEINYGTTI